MNRSEKNIPLIFRIGTVLLIAVLILSFQVSRLYARFTAVSYVSDTAQVAAFDVSADCTYNSDDGTYTLNVTNNSDVTVSYSIYDTDLPNGVRITNGYGILEPGATVSHTLVITEEFAEIHDEIKLDMIRIQQVD